MVVTVLCAGLTVVFFIISNVNEAQWKFGDEESTVEISSKKLRWKKNEIMDTSPEDKRKFILYFVFIFYSLLF